MSIAVSDTASIRVACQCGKIQPADTGLQAKSLARGGTRFLDYAFQASSGATVAMLLQPVLPRLGVSPVACPINKDGARSLHGAVSRKRKIIGVSSGIASIERLLIRFI